MPAINRFFKLTRRLGWVLALATGLTPVAVADHHGGHGGHMTHVGSAPMGGHMSPGGPGGHMSPVGIGGHGGQYSNYGGVGSGGFLGGYYSYGAVGSYFYYPPPLVVYSQGGFTPFLSPALPQQVQPQAGGLMLPLPPAQVANANAAPRPARRTNPARAREVMEIGDRSFRAGNIKRAEEKYLLAIKADPTAPAPHVHVAQVSVARGDYAAAADHLRDAVTVAADGGWLLNVPDIQSIFGEPADFAKQIARLESHLQANPNDRDAWFVLGAECYLSGRSKQASDVFARLGDRRPDEALAAFLDASNTKMPPAAN